MYLWTVTQTPHHISTEVLLVERTCSEERFLGYRWKPVIQSETHVERKLIHPYR